MTESVVVKSLNKRRNDFFSESVSIINQKSNEIKKKLKLMKDNSKHDNVEDNLIDHSYDEVQEQINSFIKYLYDIKNSEMLSYSKISMKDIELQYKWLLCSALEKKICSKSNDIFAPICHIDEMNLFKLFHVINFWKIKNFEFQLFDHLINHIDFNSKFLNDFFKDEFDPIAMYFSSFYKIKNMIILNENTSNIDIIFKNKYSDMIKWLFTSYNDTYILKKYIYSNVVFKFVDNFKSHEDFELFKIIISDHKIDSESFYYLAEKGFHYEIEYLINKSYPFTFNDLEEILDGAHNYYHKEKNFNLLTTLFPLLQSHKNYFPYRMVLDLCSDAINFKDLTVLNIILHLFANASEFDMYRYISSFAAASNNEFILNWMIKNYEVKLHNLLFISKEYNAEECILLLTKYGIEEIFDKTDDEMMKLIDKFINH